MAPAALLAIVALGMVLAYAIPQRIRERTDYALVRTEDRYSADMRVVRTTAERLERTSRHSSDSEGVPLLVTGAARASIASLGASMMSRPATALDRVATTAERERRSLRGDRTAVLRVRKAHARRRAAVAGVLALAAAGAWGLAIAGTVSTVVGAIVTAVFAGAVVLGARAAAAQRKTDARILLVAREVEAAATATQALRRVSVERAKGHVVEPTPVETQAIRIVTAEDLAPLAAPAQVPAPSLPVVAAEERESGAWSPRSLPAPAYTLKAAVRQQEARPLVASDFATHADTAESTSGTDDAEAPAPSETRPATGQLDAILARRRRVSA